MTPISLPPDDGDKVLHLKYIFEYVLNAEEQYKENNQFNNFVIDNLILYLSSIVFAYRPSCATEGGSAKCAIEFFKEISIKLKGEDILAVCIFEGSERREVVFGGHYLRSILRAYVSGYMDFLGWKFPKNKGFVERVSDRILDWQVFAGSSNTYPS